MPDAGPGTPAAAPSSPIMTRIFALYERIPRLKWGRQDIPSTLVGAYWGVLLSGVFGLLTGLALQGQLSWFRDLASDAVADSIADGDDPPLTMPTDSELRNMLLFTLITVVIIGAILVIIALSISRGKPSSRWFLMALWALATTGVVGGLAFFGIPQAISLAVNGAPLVMVIPSMICALLLLFAVVSVLCKPSRRFFAAEKGAMMEQAVAAFDARKAARARMGSRMGIGSRMGMFGRRGGADPAQEPDSPEPEAEFAPRAPRPGTEGTPKRKAARQSAAEDGVSLVKEDSSASADEVQRRAASPRSKSRASGG